MKKTLLLSLLAAFPIMSSAFSTDDYFISAYNFDDVEAGTTFPVLSENACIHLART